MNSEYFPTIDYLDMDQISEVAQEINGLYTEDALKAFDIDWLLDTRNGSAEYALREMRRERLGYWMTLAINLGMKGSSEREVLKNLQKFISVTPHNQRCPCKRMTILHPQGHYPGCEVVSTIRDREELANGLDQWKQDQLDTAKIIRLWRSKLTSHMTESQLREIKLDVDAQLNGRFFFLPCFISCTSIASSIQNFSLFFIY